MDLHVILAGVALNVLEQLSASSRGRPLGIVTSSSLLHPFTSVIVSGNGGASSGASEVAKKGRLRSATKAARSQGSPEHICRYV
jgi:hypothetical protein